jgi:hypothetical protein
MTWQHLAILPCDSATLSNFAEYSAKLGNTLQHSVILPSHLATLGDIAKSLGNIAMRRKNRNFPDLAGES